MSRFITLEGIEGSGKSLQLNLLAEEMKRRGIPCLITREPGGTEFGRELRRVLLSSKGAAREPVAELLLYLADRFQHLREVVQPALADGKWVICDRFHDATLAYQGWARSIGFDFVRNLSVPLGIRTPDLTLLLDLDVETGLSRARIRNREGEAQDESRFESEDRSFHERVREGYLHLAQAEPQRIRVIDASGSAREVFERILEALNGSGLLNKPDSPEQD